jgi:hypothetical protein
VGNARIKVKYDDGLTYHVHSNQLERLPRNDARDLLEDLGEAPHLQRFEDLDECLDLMNITALKILI